MTDVFFQRYCLFYSSTLKKPSRSPQKVDRAQSAELYKIILQNIDRYVILLYLEIIGMSRYESGFYIVTVTQVTEVILGRTTLNSNSHVS